MVLICGLIHGLFLGNRGCIHVILLLTTLQTVSAAVSTTIQQNDNEFLLTPGLVDRIQAFALENLQIATNSHACFSAKYCIRREQAPRSALKLIKELNQQQWNEIAEHLKVSKVMNKMTTLVWNTKPCLSFFLFMSILLNEVDPDRDPFNRGQKAVQLTYRCKDFVEKHDSPHTRGDDYALPSNKNTLSWQDLSAYPGRGADLMLSFIEIAPPHECLSFRYCVTKKDFAKVSLRALKLWEKGFLQGKETASLDKILRNVSTSFNTNECILLPIFIHSLFLASESDMHPGKILWSAFDISLKCHDLVHPTFIDDDYSSLPLKSMKERRPLSHELLTEEPSKKQISVSKSKTTKRRILWGNCEKGQYCASKNWLQRCDCQSCQKGRYNDNSDHKDSNCKQCPAGRYGSTNGLKVCTKCPAGRYGSTTGLMTSSCTGLCNNGSARCPGSTNSQCSTYCGCPHVSSQCTTMLTVSTEAELKNAVTAANGGTSSYVKVSSNIQFTGAMASDSALKISGATIAIVGEGGMKELKGQRQSGNYRIVWIEGRSAKVHLESLKMMNGYVSSR
eukprot:g1192.t1